MGGNWLSCWLKGLYSNPQTTQGIAKYIGCSSQADGKALLVNTTSKYLTGQKIQAVF